MTVLDLYNHITAHMTAEQALMKLLEGQARTYQKLKFNEGEELHPIMIISLASLEMGWDMAIPNIEDDKEIEGMIVGTEEYIKSILIDDDEQGDN